MRITNLAELKDVSERTLIKNAIIHDIEHIAECIYGDDPYKYFKIEFRLKRVKEEYL